MSWAFLSPGFVSLGSSETAINSSEYVDYVLLSKMGMKYTDNWKAVSLAYNQLSRYAVTNLWKPYGLMVDWVWDSYLTSCYHCSATTKPVLLLGFFSFGSAETMHVSIHMKTIYIYIHIKRNNVRWWPNLETITMSTDDNAIPQTEAVARWHRLLPTREYVHIRGYYIPTRSGLCTIRTCEQSFSLLISETKLARVFHNLWGCQQVLQCLWSGRNHFDHI